jgi:hypothetical protein
MGPSSSLGQGPNGGSVVGSYQENIPTTTVRPQQIMIDRNTHRSTHGNCRLAAKLIQRIIRTTPSDRGSATRRSGPTYQ